MFTDCFDKLDDYQISNIIRAFSKGLRGRSYGKEKLMFSIEPKLIKWIDEFNLRDLSNIAYWYAQRQTGNPDFHNLLLKKISEQIHKADFSTLHNVIYYLMFRENKDRDLWQWVTDAAVESRKE